MFQIIYDFYLNYVFNYDAPLGKVYIGALNDTMNNARLGNVYVPVNLHTPLGEGNGMLMQNWLALTSTIITLVIILVCIAYFIRWIFKIFSNSILLR